MSFLSRVEARAKVQKVQTKVVNTNSFRQAVEAKYAIVEKIKGFVSKLLKKLILPSLFILSSSTAFSQIKDPEKLGETFQKIAEQALDNKDVQVKTTVVDNGEENPQVVIYTLTTVNKVGDKSSKIIKYVEGKKAVTKTVKADDRIGSIQNSIDAVADEFRDTLDEVAKNVTKKGDGKGSVKSGDKKLADNTKTNIKKFD
jgi:uncharacterized protein YfeS